MTGAEVGAVEVVVGIAVVLAAAAALLAPGRLAGVVAFLVTGVLLSVLWALAGAPDVALAEAAIGTGVTGMLFVDTVTRAERRRRPEAGPGSRWGLLAARPGRERDGEAEESVQLSAVALTLVAATLLTAGLVPALRRAAVPLAGAEPGLAAPVLEAVPSTGVDHPVTAVLLSLRSYDTLLEVLVLLVAVVVVLVVTEPGPAAGSAAPAAAPAVPPLQRSATVVIVPILVLLAAWVLFAGSTRTGGAFQAGAVVAAALVLLRLAGRPGPAPRGRGTAWLVVAGPLAFLAVAVAGPLLGGGWLELAPTASGTVIVVLETVLAVSIGASLAAVALAVRSSSQDPSAAARGRGGRT